MSSFVPRGNLNDALVFFRLPLTPSHFGTRLCNAGRQVVLYVFQTFCYELHRLIGKKSTSNLYYCSLRVQDIGWVASNLYLGSLGQPECWHKQCNTLLMLEAEGDMFMDMDVRPTRHACLLSTVSGAISPSIP